MPEEGSDGDIKSCMPEERCDGDIESRMPEEECWRLVSVLMSI